MMTFRSKHRLHTPAPWRLLPEEVDKQYIRIRGTLPGSRYKIADVLCPSDAPGEADETRANARLIASAPELLKALKDLVRAVEENGVGGLGEMIDAAKDAIKIATN